jgi:hypothetical protein
MAMTTAIGSTQDGRRSASKGTVSSSTRRVEVMRDSTQRFPCSVRLAVVVKCERSAEGDGCDEKGKERPH